MLHTWPVWESRWAWVCVQKSQPALLQGWAALGFSASKKYPGRAWLRKSLQLHCKGKNVVPNELLLQQGPNPLCKDHPVTSRTFPSSLGHQNQVANEPSSLWGERWGRALWVHVSLYVGVIFPDRPGGSLPHLYTFFLELGASTELPATSKPSP